MNSVQKSQLHQEVLFCLCVCVLENDEIALLIQHIIMFNLIVTSHFIELFTNEFDTICILMSIVIKVILFLDNAFNQLLCII